MLCAKWGSGSPSGRHQRAETLAPPAAPRHAGQSCAHRIPAALDLHASSESVLDTRRSGIPPEAR
eukprot:3072959-Rhodomonas_salina.1